ncbi:hypothetical protein [Micromonospora sp. NPDC051006]|uniref:hypothetical protein n=1 Tax=Micromonospora sp. NPDC051006 TaxID=3364283 RepID=UPI003796EC6D
MVKWIVLAVVLFALLVLALAVRAVLARLPGLRRAAVALQRRQAEAEALAGSAAALQVRADAVSRQLADAQLRVELIRANRGD